MIDDEEINTIQYFWQDKGDLSRYAGWEKLQPILQVECPELLLAWNQYKIYERIIDRIVDSL